jgi:hypothetical protein
MFLAAAWNTARWIVQHDQDAENDPWLATEISVGIFPRLNPITIYLMIALGHSRRPAKIIAVEVLTLAVRAQPRR